MDYEKAYKEALTKSKEFYELCKKCGAKDTKEFLEDVFPELKDSEDERIKKEIIGFLKLPHPLFVGKRYQEDWISWLEKQGKIIEEYENKLDRCTCESFNKGYKSAIEKQGEQKYDDTYCKQHCKGYQETGKCFADGECKAKRDSKNLSDNKVKFKVGDWIITDKNHIWCVDEDSSSTGYLYRLVGINGKVEVAECEIVEEHSHLWTIQDAKDGNVLVDHLNNILIYQEPSTTTHFHSHCYCHQPTSSFIADEGSHEIKDAYPANKEQRDLLFQKMSEKGYEWDDEKKELKRHNTPRFKVGDWIIHTGENEMKAIRQITDITDTSYILDNVESCVFNFKDIEESYRLWSIEDAKDGDVLVSNSLVFIYKLHNEYGIVQSYCSYGENTGFTQNFNKTANMNNVYPATPEQYETLFVKIRESGYMWDSDKKKLRKIIRNPRFKAGDWIGSGTGSYFKVLAVENEYNGIKDYILLEPSGNETSYNVEFVDNTFDPWSIENAEEGDILTSTNGNTIILYKCHSEHTDIILSHCYLDNRCDDFGVKFDSWYSKAFYPATKEQRELFFKKMCEAGYEWDAKNRNFITAESNDTNYVNGEEYGIDGLFHAQRILEKTLGTVDGYETDDGILEHKCAINAVKKLRKQKPAWSEEDEKVLSLMQKIVRDSYLSAKKANELSDWLKSLKERVGG